MSDGVFLRERRRKPRMSNSEIAQRLLTAGRELVADIGVTPSFEGVISYEEVILRAGVNRTSAYRVWDRHAFYDELMVALVNPAEPWVGTAAFDKQTLATAGRALLRFWEELANGRDARQAVVREAVRVGAQRNFDYLSTSPVWRSYMALSATLHGLRPDSLQHRVRDALEQSESGFTRAMGLFYSELGAMAGLRMRPGLRWTDLAATGAAVVEGLGVREQVTSMAAQPSEWAGRSAVNPVPGPDTAAGTVQWTTASLGFLGVFETFVEYVPDEEYQHGPNTRLLELLEFVEGASSQQVQEVAREAGVD